MLKFWIYKRNGTSVPRIPKFDDKIMKKFKDKFQIKMKKPRSIEMVSIIFQFNMINYMLQERNIDVQEIVDFFFDYYDFRTKNNYLPEFIFNFDETIINLGQNNKKVAVFHNQPNPVVFDNGKLEHITLFCVSAASLFMKPLAILPLNVCLIYQKIL